jgi:site-specific DNA-adenine methylase
MRRPAFSYYGAKFRAARHYPPPMHDTIIEPFAGAAGYSMHYWDRDVILVDLDECIAGVWDLLIEWSPDDIRALPLVDQDTNIRELDVPPAAQWLIGYWCGCGCPHPRVTPTAWHLQDESYRNKTWSADTREHVALVCERVSHWTVIHGSYIDAPETEATWFVDPPYQDQGKHYRHGSRDLDYSALADWCRARRGQVMVCEQDGADWLPFEPLADFQSAWRPATGAQTKTEVMWSNMQNPWPQLKLEGMA